MKKLKTIAQRKKWNMILGISDIIMMIIASYLALLTRFEFYPSQIAPIFLKNAAKYMPLNLFCSIVIFMAYRLYSTQWKYAGISDFINVVKAVVIAAAFQLIGAGEAGSIILNEIKKSTYVTKTIRCIIDDDPAKKGTYLSGIPVVGNRNTILRNAVKFDVEDLLGREPVKANLPSIMSYVKDRVVFVTGGGGSIGSEICRQIARYQPKKLVIIDNYENNAYEIQMELKRTHPELDLKVLIVSVQNHLRIHNIFEDYKPDIVFHAAAHKHVPLMEDSPHDAIKNNVFGTFNIAQEAGMSGVKRMVLISTDKAVRPTNIMGASKRICEMVIQYMNSLYDTEYVAVRFGNVLGSNGSVVPLFKKQIANGGPVTVTHPEIIRYFMTIPEAVSLVLEAGAYAEGGEIFILDMGEPVKILDLAKNMIRLSGLTPGEDIEIQFTGLRPGEKLYEELLIDEENKKETKNKRIFIGSPRMMETEQFSELIAELDHAAFSEDPNIREVVKRLVPEYTYKQTNQQTK